jgi:hypothetical protein
MILQYDKAQAVLHAGAVCSSNGEAMISGTTCRITLNCIRHTMHSYTLFEDNCDTKFDLPTKGLGCTHEIKEGRMCIKNG